MGLGDGAELNRERVPLDVIRLHGGALPSRIIRFRGAGAGKGTEASPHIKQYYISFTVAFILYLYAGSEDGSKTRIRMANEKHSKNITQRGNVAKTLVRLSFVVCIHANEWRSVWISCLRAWFGVILRHTSRPMLIYSNIIRGECKS